MARPVAASPDALAPKTVKNCKFYEHPLACVNPDACQSREAEHPEHLRELGSLVGRSGFEPVTSSVSGNYLRRPRFRFLVMSCCSGPHVSAGVRRCHRRSLLSWVTRLHAQLGTSMTRCLEGRFRQGGPARPRSGVRSGSPLVTTVCRPFWPDVARLARPSFRAGWSELRSIRVESPSHGGTKPLVLPLFVMTHCSYEQDR